MATEMNTGNAWYEKHYSFFMMSLIGVMVIVIALVFILFYQIKHKPLPRFIAVTPEGRMLDLVPYETPNLLPSSLIKWASKAAVAASTLDFVNYDKQLLLVKPYFTEGGWVDYRNSMDALIDTVRKNQLLVNGVVSGAPIIASQGPVAGREYAWRLQMPFVVTYQASDTTSKKQFTLMMTIVRIPTSKNPAAIGIDQFLMMEAS